MFDIQLQRDLHVVLDHEDDVKQDRHIPKTELRSIASNTGPVRLKRRVDNKLRNGQYSASKVKKNLTDCPSNGRLALVVEVDLWHVLDDRHEQFDVAEGVDLSISAARTGNCSH
jgi:hypothetical protein